MGESRPEHPAADPPRTTSGLSPVQQAYSDYVRHALACQFCRDVDAGPCATAEQLWQTYRQAYEDAFAGLAAERHHS